MAKIYDKQGNKMGIAGICEELMQTLSSEQKELLTKSINNYNCDNQSRLAHGILDIYRLIDSTSEQGMRIRKLLNYLMTKYQKATPANNADQVIYKDFIDNISK